MNKRLIIIVTLIIATIAVGIVSLFTGKKSEPQTPPVAQSNQQPDESPSDGAGEVSTDEVHAVITQTYPELISQANLSPGEFVLDGEWYITVLTYKNSTNDNPRDRYRVILENTPQGWRFAGKPAIIHTTHTLPDVPHQVLERAYRYTP